jgi:hypothetical protein
MRILDLKLTRSDVLPDFEQADNLARHRHSISRCVAACRLILLQLLRCMTCEGAVADSSRLFLGLRDLKLAL